MLYPPGPVSTTEPVLMLPLWHGHYLVQLDLPDASPCNRCGCANEKGPFCLLVLLQGAWSTCCCVNASCLG